MLMLAAWGTVRGWRGTAAFAPQNRRPEKLLKLYDIEASPYCRLVREVLTELDLDVLVLPCPAGGTAPTRVGAGLEWSVDSGFAEYGIG